MRSGKTVFTVLEAAQTKGVILVANKERADQLMGLAKRMGVTIRRPVVVQKKPTYQGVSFWSVIVDDPDLRRKNA